MINVQQFKECVITPALDALKLYSDSAVELLLFTCAVESLGGTYLKQIKGPGLGIFQMEPATYNDVWRNYILSRSDLSLLMTHNFDASRIPPPERMMYDLRFATAMARIHYRRVKDPLPAVGDIDAMWEYYKKFYNTPAGKSTKDKSIKMYKEFIK